MMVDRVENGPNGVTIAVEGLHKAFGRGSARTPVLNGVDLSVARGQCVYLAGPSGSGKTTLLSILGCILTPDQGGVRILDQDVVAMDHNRRTALRLEKIGFIFQRFHLIRGLNALQNVCVPLTLRKSPPRKARRRGMELLEAVGIPEKARSHARHLSGGQCQRVAIARALAGDPELILADEPTAALDATNGQEIMTLFRRLIREERKTAVVVTHDQRIFRFADHVFWLENGRVVDAPEAYSASGPHDP
jgi:putative ABC transport system ATP-binding protein